MSTLDPAVLAVLADAEERPWSKQTGTVNVVLTNDVNFYGPVAQGFKSTGLTEALAIVHAVNTFAARERERETTQAALRAAAGALERTLNRRATRESMDSATLLVVVDALTLIRTALGEETS